MTLHIKIKKKKYYYFDTFKSWKEAYQVYKGYKKIDNKNRYFIIINETGIIAPYKEYKLYMTKIKKMFGIPIISKTR